MGSLIGLICCLVSVMGLLGGASAATQYTVGDSFGWAIPPNNSADFYDDWVSNKTFQIGDSVLFNWTGTHTATEVSKEDYENCTKLGIILATPGVIVHFNENATRYFLCSIRTHCEQGQKVKFEIGDVKSNTTGSAPSPLVVGAAFSLLLSTLVFSFLHYYA